MGGGKKEIRIINLQLPLSGFLLDNAPTLVVMMSCYHLSGALTVLRASLYLVHICVNNPATQWSPALWRVPSGS